MFEYRDHEWQEVVWLVERLRAHGLALATVAAWCAVKSGDFAYQERLALVSSVKTPVTGLRPTPETHPASDLANSLRQLLGVVDRVESYRVQSVRLARASADRNRTR